MKRMKQLDKIEITKSKKREILQHVMKPKHSNKMKYGVAFAMVVVLLVTSLSLFSKSPTSLVVSSIAMEVNPTIILNLDSNNKVIEVVDQSGDAMELLQEVNVIGEDVQEAMSQILDSQIYQAKYANNYLEVSIYSENQNLSSSLNQLVDVVLQENLDGRNCHSQQVDKETWEGARKRNMGVGKYAKISNILESSDEYTFEQLEHCSMKELNEIQSKCQKGHGYRKGCN